LAALRTAGSNEVKALEGRGSLREERFAGSLLQAAWREQEDRAAAERQAGSVRAKRTLLSLPRL
jgi:hypothetical protein